SRRIQGSGHSAFDPVVSLLGRGPDPRRPPPVLCPRDGGDFPADGVADPFMIRADGAWYMFFEVLSCEKGVIAFATSSDALNWSYQRVVLEERFHLSYPYVFEWRGEYLMVPETLKAGSIRLYKTSSFPDSWQFAGNLIDTVGADPSPFRYARKRGMLPCPLACKHRNLSLYLGGARTGR